MQNQTVEIIVRACDFRRSFFGRKLTLNPRNADSASHADADVASEMDTRDWPAGPADPSSRPDTGQLSFVSGALAVRNERTAA
ncbi:MAG TPA: hypothetical protein VI756_04780 [Blastocatellia bacterium]